MFRFFHKASSKRTDTLKKQKRKKKASGRLARSFRNDFIRIGRSAKRRVAMKWRGRKRERPFLNIGGERNARESPNYENYFVLAIEKACNEKGLLKIDLIKLSPTKRFTFSHRFRIAMEMHLTREEGRGDDESEF